MKVQTNVKAGGGLLGGLLDLDLIAVVVLDLDLFGCGGCKKKGC